MRILVVSHFFPPLRDGGYAQLCAEVCQALKERGNQIEVLTSRFGTNGQENRPGVHRLLYLENDLLHYSPSHFFSRWITEEGRNEKAITRLVKRLEPDIVFIWGMYGLSRSIPAKFEAIMPGRVVYFISDHWPADLSLNQAYWCRRTGTGKRRYLINLLSPMARVVMSIQNYPPSLKFERAIIVSHAVRRNLISSGLPLSDSVVIHSGTNPKDYLYHRDYESFIDHSFPVKALYAGNLGEHKGVHTAVNAMALLREELARGQLTLTIMGSGHPLYESKLRQLIKDQDLQSWITMANRLPREEIPDVLWQHDLLLLPSNCEDALPRIIQEGMLAGMIVIGSDRGGIPEMVKDDETGLVFPAKNVKSLANRIRSVLRERLNAVALARRGQQLVLSDFTIDVMARRLDTYLQKVLC